MAEAHFFCGPQVVQSYFLEHTRDSVFLFIQIQKEIIYRSSPMSCEQALGVRYLLSLSVVYNLKCLISGSNYFPHIFYKTPRSSTRPILFPYPPSVSRLSLSLFSVFSFQSIQLPQHSNLMAAFHFTHPLFSPRCLSRGSSSFLALAVHCPPFGPVWLYIA